MSAATYTPDEERRYGLRSLPETPFVGPAETERLNAAYAEARKAYRARHPHLTREIIAGKAA